MRALLDRGLVVEDERGRRLAPRVEATRLGELGAPASLQVLIASRLDALPAAERDVVQVAAVLGTSFTLDGLRAMAGLPPRRRRWAAWSPAIW